MLERDRFVVKQSRGKFKVICSCEKVSKRLMRRKTNSDNVNVMSKGIQFTFDTDSEAQDFYKECQDKLTASEI